MRKDVYGNYLFQTAPKFGPADVDLLIGGQVVLDCSVIKGTICGDPSLDCVRGAHE